MLSAPKKNGAGNEARTRDLNLGKIASEHTQIVNLLSDSGTLTHSVVCVNSRSNAALQGLSAAAHPSLHYSGMTVKRGHENSRGTT